MKRFLVFWLPLCWVCPLQAQTFGAFLNGEELYSYLTSQDESQRMGARGYIAGIVDLHVVMVSSYSAPRLFCRPGGLTRDRTRDIVKEYLENNPESRQVFAAEVVTRALGEAYPCPK
jgi:hypothetical protein